MPGLRRQSPSRETGLPAERQVAAKVRRIHCRRVRNGSPGEIGNPINAIQGAAGQLVAVIRGIGKTIDEMREISSYVAMENEGVATRDSLSTPPFPVAVRQAPHDRFRRAGLASRRTVLRQNGGALQAGLNHRRSGDY